MILRLILFLAIPLIAFLLALIGMALARKIGFLRSFAVYIFVLGICVFIELRFTHSGLSLIDVVVNFAVFLVISVFLLFLMKKASVPLLEKWLSAISYSALDPKEKTLHVASSDLREINNQDLLADAPADPRTFLCNIIQKAETQGKFNLASISAPY